MKNLMSRDEYLQKVEEGFIRDTIKKGIDKVKNLFALGMKKIKDFIAVFDSKGNVLPVVTPQAVIDHFAGNGAIHVYGSKAMVNSVKAAGGKACPVEAPLSESDEVYDYIDEESIEYKNLKSIPSIIKECYENYPEETALFESTWQELKKNRTSYSAKTSGEGEFASTHVIKTSEFERKLKRMLDERIFATGDKRVREKDMYKPILIFGAPGIGKSTVPDAVIRKYNEGVSDPSKMLSLVTVDCANVNPGEFMMPTMPQVEDVQAIIKDNPDTFPQAAKYLEDLSPEQQAKLADKLAANKQWRADEAPKSWVPSYKDTGDPELNAILDAKANCGVYEDDDEVSHKTGNGGILMFDEFLRCDPNVFKQLMIFLITRKFNEYRLGSKWIVIGCTNRPCDDTEVANAWASWDNAPAQKDRWDGIFYLEPEPEQWKEWARKRGCDEFLLKFIFDEDPTTSKVGDEYARWHSQIQTGTSGQIKPITPRAWERAFIDLNKFKKENDINDLSQMSREDIEEVFGGKFDEYFIKEIVNWMKDHAFKVELDDIINDPVNTPIPEALIDQGKATVLVKNIYEQFEDRFKDEPKKCTDEILNNVIIWFGRNYPGDWHTFQVEFLGKIAENIFKGGSDYDLSSFPDALLTMYAAWPFSDIEDMLKAREEDGFFEEGSFEVAKEKMRKYFPNRIDGDHIKFYDALETE